VGGANFDFEVIGIFLDHGEGELTHALLVSTGREHNLESHGLGSELSTDRYRALWEEVKEAVHYL